MCEDVDFDEFEESEGGGSVLYFTIFLLKHFKSIFISDDAQFGSLQVLDIFGDDVL